MVLLVVSTAGISYHTLVTGRWPNAFSQYAMCCDTDQGCGVRVKFIGNQLKQVSSMKNFRLRRARPAALRAALFTKKHIDSLHLLGPEPDLHRTAAALI